MEELEIVGGVGEGLEKLEAVGEVGGVGEVLMGTSRNKTTKQQARSLCHPRRGTKDNRSKDENTKQQKHVHPPFVLPEGELKTT